MRFQELLVLTVAGNDLPQLLFKLPVRVLVNGFACLILPKVVCQTPPVQTRG